MELWVEDGLGEEKRRRERRERGEEREERDRYLRSAEGARGTTLFLASGVDTERLEAEVACKPQYSQESNVQEQSTKLKERRGNREERRKSSF